MQFGSLESEVELARFNPLTAAQLKCAQEAQSRQQLLFHFPRLPTPLPTPRQNPLNHQTFHRLLSTSYLATNPFLVIFLLLAPSAVSQTFLDLRMMSHTLLESYPHSQMPVLLRLAYLC